MTLQPRRKQMRAHSKTIFQTSPPLKPRSKVAELPKFSGSFKESGSSVQPSPQIEITTSRPLDRSTTTWWPSGIYLGHRPPRTHLPLHIINPNSLKWERKFPNIWFRTGGTKFTYAPEVVNYPITFNWSIPKDKRVDKYTEKPDWPLNSPLFGSNEIYDYLEEVSLPSPVVSGETEFPQTTAQPWWTFPPWWLKKVDEEEKYGIKNRPQEGVYIKPTVTTLRSTTQTPIKLEMQTKPFKMPSNHTKPLKTTRSYNSTPKSFLHTPPSKASVTNVVHHRGPWWKLTVVEHHNHKREILTRYEDETKRKKRSILTRKPLVRQNAFRRKFSFGSKNKTTNKFESERVNTSQDGNIVLQSDKRNINSPRSKREDNIRPPKEEKVTLNLNQATNWSTNSMEIVLKEVVSEIPMKDIRTEVKKGILTELHTEKIRSLGKKQINTEVISKMASLEAESPCVLLDQETDNSVKNLIQKLLEEVLSSLRGNKWMRDAMIKIFEDGYSTKSVLETVVNELSIDSILDAMGKEGINITKQQKDKVLFDFKNYKPELTKMLEKEILLWDKEESNKIFPLRNKRSVHLETIYSGFTKKLISYSLSESKLKKWRSRQKRNVGEINNSLEMINHEKDDLSIDKEISDLKKSSLPDVEKIRKLKKRLKWLQSQTENPSDIVFPENFEEELMVTESFDDSKLKFQRLPKKRFQWSVRTKKPTLKTITFIPKIRLERGKIFVPLTTTEEQLIIPSTLKPALKRRKIKSAVSRKKIKVIGSDQEATLSPAISHLLLKTNKPVKTAVRHTAKPKSLRRFTRKNIVTSIPETFATLKSFHTMKFGKPPKKNVISLQEFLKRRNEFRQEREEVMWNKNFLHSTGEVPSTRKIPTLRAIQKENEYSTDEEEGELSFDAKLSGEIKASDFTLRPLSDFLYTRAAKPNTTELKSISDFMTDQTGVLEVLSSENKPPVANMDTQATKIKSRNNNNKSADKNISQSGINVSDNQGENHYSSHESSGERVKRNILQVQSDSPSTYKDSSTSNNKEEKTMGDHHVTANHQLDNSIIGEQNKSQADLERKIQSNSKLRVIYRQCPGINQYESNSNVTVSSFETYQQEHKKWFGVRRRGVPVNNFDIDWDQMRRKLEVQQLSVWEKQKRAHKFDGKELRKYWNIRSKTKFETEITTSKIHQLELGVNNIFQSTKRIKLASSLDDETKTYTPVINKHQHIDTKSNIKDDIERESLEPPFGKADKDGKTAFGRLYEEPKKRHYRVFDNRDLYFDEKDIKNLINNTYCSDFRLMTHRKTQWHNRTYDPNFIFTQSPTERDSTTHKLRHLGSNKAVNDSDFHTAYTGHLNDSKIIDSDFNNYINALIENRFMSLRPKHQSYKDKDNNTVIINQENDTFILQRSKRIPLDNNTDLEAYKAYKRSRKRFYNKTIDIVFSYYIFHKFKCGNFTRDLGYGRMSNVVNRWYNRTFVPKFRPDMFYVHNRYKAGKEFNFFRNEFNIVHSMISEGKFDPSKWGHVLVTRNSTRSGSVEKSEFNEIKEINDNLLREKSYLNFNRKPEEQKEFSTEFSIRSARTLNPNFKQKQNLNTTTLRFSKLSALHRSQFSSTRTPFTSITKKSFFKAVKDKGFVFFKSLFGIKNKNNDASK